MNVIVVLVVVAVLLALAVPSRLLWLWATRDRRFEAAQARFQAELGQAERKRALVTDTALMAVVTEAPVGGGDTPDVVAAHGVQPTASTSSPSGGIDGNADVATDIAPTGAVVRGGLSAGEPIHRNPVVGASAGPRPLLTPQPVLRAGVVSTARQTASPTWRPASGTRTPRSA